jgi:bisphosphoglycerate-independent phosphoglycerate mutase (AlkP superfamily)
MENACQLLITLDQVLDGLVANWDNSAGVILITSDHGNMEDLSTRRHTTNPVPVLLIGAPHLRRDFINSIHNLMDVAPAILNFFKLPVN